ncbi:MAG: DUF481 domain-containing protein [Bacteroidota bacterium]|nr:DUF481 domain-containing protein [Bacteroidota bacterium]
MQKLIFFSLFIFLFSNSYSQVVNIEKKRKEYKQGFQGSISLQFGIIQNTSQILQGSNTAHLQYTKGKSTLLILNDYSLMKVQKGEDDFDLINKNFQHLRFNYSIIDTNAINFEFLIQRQQNKIKFLQFRFLAGTGFRFRLINNDFIQFYIAPLIMYENEILSDSAQTTTKMLKGNLYSSLYINLTEDISFSNVIYYQPAISNLNNYADFERFIDYRISSESSFSIKILKNLKFSVVFKLAYDSKPPIELISNPLFYDLTNVLTYKF